MNQCVIRYATRVLLHRRNHVLYWNSDLASHRRGVNMGQTVPKQIIAGHADDVVSNDDTVASDPLPPMMMQLPPAECKSHVQTHDKLVFN